ncbi:hypothetical protein ACLMJV_07280 [Sinorhizobium meliloti]|jgi:hypothetical protein|uniref:hypothetical protein n=1 Tax=Rhizobium meliloti TaxID=382 RepID=UPI00398D1BE6
MTVSASSRQCRSGSPAVTQRGGASRLKMPELIAIDAMLDADRGADFNATPTE